MLRTLFESGKVIEPRVREMRMYRQTWGRAPVGMTAVEGWARSEIQGLLRHG